MFAMPENLFFGWFIVAPSVGLFLTAMGVFLWPDRERKESDERRKDCDGCNRPNRAGKPSRVVGDGNRGSVRDGGLRIVARRTY